VWDESNYADYPMTFMTDLRRFLSLWAYDLGSSEITQALQRIGVKPPPTALASWRPSIPSFIGGRSIG
jgi:hypothetical protein